MDFRQEIIKLVEKEVKFDHSLLEVPPDNKLGDFALPCFPFAKEMKKRPNEIAEELAKNIKPNDIITEIKSTGPYLNFFVNRTRLAEDTTQDILKKKEKYGFSGIGDKKKVIVEFPSPNTNKPLHLGHLRNMALGESLSNIIESQGYNTIRVNLNNDRGIHICKSMLAYKKWGKDRTPGSEGKKSDHFVGDYYVRFCAEEKKDPEFSKEAQEMLKRWEEGDPEVRALWKKMNHWAFEGFDKTYREFGLKKFAKVYFESETYKLGKEIVQDGLQKGIFTKKDDGAVAVDLEKEDLGEKVLLRADGTSVYVTQDLYLAQLKHKDFDYDRSVYVVASEQDYHFKVLFTLLKKMKYKFADGCHHFSYGMVNLPEGKMKSREGTVVDADDLILEMEDLAKEEIIKRYDDLEEQQIHDRSRVIGLGALKFYLLMIDAVKDMTFHPEQSISFEGDTGPYVQYTHARACSILRKAETQGINPEKSADFTTLSEDQEFALVQALSEFPQRTEEAAGSYRPHFIAQYLLHLSRAFNEFYHSCPCLKEENKQLANARLLLVDCTRQVIMNGLQLLGIKAPEEM